jgi:multidrug efflux pump subunit AcrA (membrane-fusion protein)
VSFHTRRKLAELFILAAASLACSGCSRQAKSAEPSQALANAPTIAEKLPVSASGIVRATGLVQALEWQSVRAPQLTGVTGGDMILVGLIPNGSKVSKGDVIIEFDRVNLLDQERDAVATLENLQHQLEERKAQVASLQATRGSQVREAQADLARAQLQLRKGPVLSDIDRKKNEARAEDAQARVESLGKSDALRAKAEEASIKILELKVDRQRVTLERYRMNLDRLLIRAPQNGMVAYETTWRQGSMGPPQVGDRMWPGMPIVRIFNPARMIVQATVDEPDFVSVSKASRARVFLDAYPNESFEATLQSASPVATAGIDTPVRNFTVVFRIEDQSPKILPDLSAALEIEKQAPAPEAKPAIKAGL